MMIMKNNFDFDMWETHTSGDRWSTFIIAYPGNPVVYPSWWLDDGNYCGNGCLSWWGGCVNTCIMTLVNYYQNLEQTYIVGSTINGITGTSRTIMFSDY